MPRSSEELISSRKDEILNACARLYETKGFRDITIRDIGAQTSFTRTSIYNYFQTKEEIFLGLLQREYEYWICDLVKIAESTRRSAVEAFSEALACSLDARGCMLKLLCMNLYDMEGNSRTENLVAFKKVYARAMDTLRLCLYRLYPEISEAATKDFLYALFPFLFGIYPYTTATKKQLEAMKLAGISAPDYSIHDIVKPFTLNLLNGLIKQ